MDTITLPSGAVLSLGKGVCTHPIRRTKKAAPAVTPVAPKPAPVAPQPVVPSPHVGVDGKPVAVPGAFKAGA